MAGEWPVTKVGEVAASISDTHKFGKEQLIFLNTSDILHGEFLHQTYSAVKDWPGQAKKSIRKDDILFSEIRPANGRWAFVDQDADDFVVSTKLMVIRSKQDQLLPMFLYLFLTSTKITKWLQHLAESRSGTFPQITFDQVETLELPLPPLPVQRAIAGILGALDDKIELNRQMNETLESMARAIFKSWFVDFDPVRAKMDGQQPPGMNPETAALFPDSFEEQDGEMVPKGWRNATLGELAQNVSITYDFNSTPDVVFINTGDVLEGDFLHCNRSVKEELPGQAKKTIQPNDILFTEIRPANKRFAFVDFDASDYVVSTKFMVIRSLGEIHPRLLYRNVTSANALRDFQVVAESRSGTFPQITFDSVAHHLIVLTSFEVQEAYQANVDPLDAQIKTNKRASQTLANLRDTLLPKLLSGELRVPEAEKQVEEVA